MSAEAGGEAETPAPLPHCLHEGDVVNAYAKYPSSGGYTALTCCYCGRGEGVRYRNSYHAPEGHGGHLPVHLRTVERTVERPAWEAEPCWRRNPGMAEPFDAWAGYARQREPRFYGLRVPGLPVVTQAVDESKLPAVEPWVPGTYYPLTSLKPPAPQDPEGAPDV